MKRFFKSSIYILFSILLFTCQQNEITPDGEFEFSFTLNQLSGGRISSDVADAHSVLVSIDRIDGTNVLNRKQIALFKFTDTYITEPIALEVGTYLLTEFLVLDEDENVIFATPKKLSELENFVADSLPIEFEITQDESNKVTLSVISTAGLSSKDFGYHTISFSVAPTFEFNMSVFIYDEVTQNFELTDAQLLVKVDQDTLLERSLLNETNRVTLKEEIEEYELIVKKSDYTDFRKVVSRDFLQLFQDSVYIVKLFDNVDLTNGLVAYYPFNGNALDSSGNNLNGQPYGDATYSYNRYGVNGMSLALDGNYDYVSINDHDLLDFGIIEDSSFSISLWYNSRGDNGQYANYILGKGITQSSLTTDYGFAIHNDAQNMGVQKLIWHSGAGTDYCAFSYFDMPETDGWHHVAMVINSQTGTTGTKKFFLDGNLISSCEYGEKVEARTEDLLIGAALRPDGGIERFFDGFIDDVYIYRRELSETEVLVLYTN